MGRKLPTKKPKALSIKNIEKQCLSLWSLCVRTRDKVCRICGSDYRLQGHHIRSRSHKATYLDLDNGLSACARCHIIQKFNPEKFQDMVIAVIGDEEYQRLKAKSQNTWKPDVHELLLIKDILKTQLRIFEDEYGKRHDQIREECGL